MKIRSNVDLEGNELQNAEGLEVGGSDPIQILVPIMTTSDFIPFLGGTLDPGVSITGLPFPFAEGQNAVYVYDVDDANGANGVYSGTSTSGLLTYDFDPLASDIPNGDLGLLGHRVLVSTFDATQVEYNNSGPSEYVIYSTGEMVLDLMPIAGAAFYNRITSVSGGPTQVNLVCYEDIDVNEPLTPSLVVPNYPGMAIDEGYILLTGQTDPSENGLYQINSDSTLGTKTAPDLVPPIMLIGHSLWVTAYSNESSAYFINATRGYPGGGVDTEGSSSVTVVHAVIDGTQPGIATDGSWTTERQGYLPASGESVFIGGGSYGGMWQVSDPITDPWIRDSAISHQGSLVWTWQGDHKFKLVERSPSVFHVISGNGSVGSFKGTANYIYTGNNQPPSPPDGTWTLGDKAPTHYYDRFGKMIPVDWADGSTVLIVYGYGDPDASRPAGIYRYTTTPEPTLTLINEVGPFDWATVQFSGGGTETWQHPGWNAYLRRGPGYGWVSQAYPARVSYAIDFTNDRSMDPYVGMSYSEPIDGHTPVAGQSVLIFGHHSVNNGLWTVGTENEPWTRVVAGVGVTQVKRIVHVASGIYAGEIFIRNGDLDIEGDGNDYTRFIIPNKKLVISEAVSSTARDLAFSDVGKVVESHSPNPTTFTIPTEAEAHWRSGDIIEVCQMGAGALTISGDVGVTVRNAGTLPARYASASLRYRGSDEWVLKGDEEVDVTDTDITLTGEYSGNLSTATPPSTLDEALTLIDGFGLGGESIKIMESAIYDGGNLIDLEDVGPADVDEILLYGRVDNNENGIYSVSTSTGWTKLEESYEHFFVRGVISSVTFESMYEATGLVYIHRDAESGSLSAYGYMNDKSDLPAGSDGDIQIKDGPDFGNLSTSNFMMVVAYVDDVGVARPNAGAVYWHGFPTEPTNIQDGDLWYEP